MDLHDTLAPGQSQTLDRPSQPVGRAAPDLFARLTQVLNTLVDGARPDAVVGRSEFITARNAVLPQRGQ